MEPIVCEVCYEFFGTPSKYLVHYTMEHEDKE